MSLHRRGNYGLMLGTDYGSLRGAGGMVTVLPPRKAGINACSWGDIKSRM